MSNKEISPIIEALGLEANPDGGGWIKEVWISPVDVPKSALSSHSGDRKAASTIYFLLHPGEETPWHKVQSAEIFFWHAGSPLKILFGGEEEKPQTSHEVVLGQNVVDGEHPQIVVPAGVWQAARNDGDEPTLVSALVVPGFHIDDYEEI